MKRAVVLLLLPLLFSCNSETETPTFTASLAAVTEFYSCPPDHQMGETPDGKFLEVVFTDCPAFRKQKELLEFDAANCAYLLHENLPSNMNSAFSMYKISILRTGDGAAPPLEFTLPVAEVQQAQSQVPIFSDAADILKIKEYHRIYERFVPEIGAQVDTAVLSHHFDSLHTVMGSVISAQFQGFKQFEMNLNGKPTTLLHLRGVLNREKANVNFNVVVDPSLEGRNVVGLSFE